MQEKDLFKVPIPTKAYIKKYLEHHYGDPIRFPEESFELKALKLFLAKPSKERDSSNQHGHYPIMMTVMIDERVFIRNGFHLTRTDVYQFNSCLDSMIKRGFRMYCDAARFAGIDIKDAILSWMQKHSITEDDISFEALKKYDYRCRLEMTKKRGIERSIEVPVSRLTKPILRKFYAPSVL